MRRASAVLAFVLFVAMACGEDEATPAAGDPTGAATNAGSATTARASTTAVSVTPSVATPPPRAVVTATPPATAAGASCTAFPGGVTPATSVVRTMTSGGIAREYRLHVPAGTKATERAPLVLNFHGLGSNALEQELYSGLIPLSEREGFVLVSPDGTGSPRGFASFRTLPNGVDDVLFTRDLLDVLARELCIDAARIYSTGLSNGAFQSSLLGCLVSDRIAAIAPVAGARYPKDETCGRAMPVLAIHGTADAVVPFDAGNILGVLPWDGVRANVDAWRAKNGCAGGKEERLGEHVTREVGQGCAAAVDLIVVRDGGHTWPGGVEVPRLGATTQEISAAEVIWAFFKGQTLK